MVERVRELTNSAPDLILNSAPPSGVLPDLVKIAGNPQHVLTITDFAEAAKLGVRHSFGGNDASKLYDKQGDDFAKNAASMLRYDVLKQFAALAADGRFSVPVARTFALEECEQHTSLAPADMLTASCY